MEIIYPNSAIIIKYNNNILKKKRLKKADKHELLSISRINKTLEQVKKYVESQNNDR